MSVREIRPEFLVGGEKIRKCTLTLFPFFFPVLPWVVMVLLYTLMNIDQESSMPNHCDKSLYLWEKYFQECGLQWL